MIRLDRELAALYTRALVAIARADGEISFDEGMQLHHVIARRCEQAPSLEDLLLEPPLAPHELLGVVAERGPFRGAAIHPAQLAELLVGDAIAILLAKGHATSEETALLRAFAAALGATEADFARMTAHVSRWLVPLA
ncbi:MAG TPA: hypothetical protein VLX92_08195 [Kofleriaceae bacterium]|nr:hypothetical protein [Kofleriaceae bacterium]